MKRAKFVAIKHIKLFAAETVSHLRGGEIFALLGPLGSGKTTFVKEVGKLLKIKNKITSPTFSIMHRFAGRLPGEEKTAGKKIYFYHLDLYRTKDFKESSALGLSEFWGKPGTLTFIEWADKIKKHLPKKTKTIKFKN